MKPRPISFPVLSLLVALSLLCSSLAPAQTTDAHVSGLVTDPSKAALVDTGVVAVNVDTGVRAATKTNGSGYYSLPPLPPGNYQIQVEHTGFKSVVEGGIVLHVQDAIPLVIRLNPAIRDRVKSGHRERQKT